MRYSLPSRELITDCIETGCNGYSTDAIISLGGCDKSVPASLMPLVRLNTIGITVYGGAAYPGKSCNNIYKNNMDPGTIMEAIGKCSNKEIDIEDLHKIECTGIPTIGSCSAMFTSCTMACMLASLGMSLPDNVSTMASS